MDADRPGAAGQPWLETSRELIERTLAAARAELDLDVAYLTEFVEDEQVVRATYGNASAFGLEEGASVVLEGSYCQRVLDGRLPSVIPDTAANPETRALAVTAEAGLGAYVGVPVRFSDGSLYGTLCAASTTAEPRLAERDISFMNVLARMLADAVERERAHEHRHTALQRASGAKSAFISTLTHELRTPLNAILRLAELMEDGARPDQTEHLRHIRHAGAHVLALVGETLDLARIEAGELRMTVEPIDAHRALREAAALMVPVAAARGSRIDVSVGETQRPFIEADGQRLHQVVLNLLSNAVKYGGAEIVVTCRESERHVEIGVADNGSGIPSKQLDRLFTPFERIGADSGGEQGTGLGLALTRQLVELMNGRIDVTSDDGRGTCFTIRLPRAAAPPSTARLPSAAHTTSNPSRARVIYVEDDPGNRHLVEVVLADRADVHGVARGADAVQLAVQDPPDLILLDLHLPDMGGLDVLTELRRRPETQATPVVLVTGDSDPELQRIAVELGATAVLTKPWQIDDLKAVVGASVASGDTAVGATHSSGGPHAS